MRCRFIITNLFIFGLIASCVIITGCSNRHGRVRDRTVFVDRDRDSHRRHYIVEDYRRDNRYVYDQRDGRRYDRRYNRY